MSTKKEQITAAFESLKVLMCDMGMFVEGDESDGIYFRYWGSQNLRQLTTFRGGERDGFEVRRFGPVNPPHFRHLKGGVPFGESKSVLRSGQGIEHALLDGDLKIPYSEEDAVRFKGYLTTPTEEALYKKYAVFPGRNTFLL